MFYDWLTIYQDFDFMLPLIGDRAHIVIDTDSGEALTTTQPTVKHQGSFSTSINIRISGNRLTVQGNPSRINRMENLFGFTTIDQCVECYNVILRGLGLPAFTKCTKTWLASGKDGEKVRTVSDGAVFTEIHITSNKCVGQNCEDDYLRGISTLPYRNSIPRLHTNAKTCDWLSKAGKGGALIYPSVYNKAFELTLHTLPKIKRQFGTDSNEIRYLWNVINHCQFYGVVRFEQKLKSAYLRRENLNHYGLFDESIFKPLHEEFLNLDKKLQVESMNLETITTKLIRENICTNTKAANVTTLYAIQWMHGTKFDFAKSQVKTHRARLRKIGIDISLPCDLTKFSLVHVRDSRAIELKDLSMPTWYKKPQ
ncbi:MAG: Replication-associated protein G2P, partial [Gammaproteobacteria bacterium]